MQVPIKDLGPRLVLASHYPPCGTNVDKAWNGGVHIDSRPVHRLIERVKPLAILRVHVHEFRGVDKLGNTIIVNPGPLINGYYVIIDIDGAVNVGLNKL